MPIKALIHPYFKNICTALNSFKNICTHGKEYFFDDDLLPTRLFWWVRSTAKRSLAGKPFRADTMMMFGKHYIFWARNFKVSISIGKIT